MVKVYIEKVASTEFTGFVYKNELTKEQQALFPLDLEFVNIDGCYALDNDEIVIEYIMVHDGNTEIELNSDDVDMYEIALEVAEIMPHYDEDLGL